ncbi:PR domain zinc finger protein 5-like [Folsomia candida]|uniref:PR domain zinc finger protein 5-like n=1 Tax=Folsomia candida TaxID=158441 RepID=UPI001604DB7C|nr:PR domain zinc finger protein 5-like [Folsomia candida]
MSREDVLLKHQKNRTGHILQDLISSTVLLHRSNFDPPTEKDHNFPPKMEEDNSSPELLTSFCSICTESGTNLRPLAVQEMEILAKFVLNQEQVSLIFQTESHPPILCCKICYSAILSLAKLSTQIENITSSLRAVISSRNGLFNKGRNEPAKISELSLEIPANIDQISNNDDDQQLTGCLEEEEEFVIKVEPIYDDEDDDRDEITSDPLNLSENEDDEPNFANSEVDAESKLVCKICRPNVTFTRADAYKRHMINKKKHPDISDADILTTGRHVCKKCGVKFARKERLLRHMSNHSDADMGANKDVTNSESDVEVELSYKCKMCQPKAIFHRLDTFKRHLKNKNIHPDLSEADVAAAAKEQFANVKQNEFPCPKCDKSFTSEWTLTRHNRFLHGAVPFKRKCTPQVSTSLLQNQIRKHRKVVIPRSKTKAPRHSCDICGKNFATWGNMNRHVELLHFPDKTSCPYGCDAKFGSEADWLTHLEGCYSPKMSAESECPCKSCPAVFRNILLQMDHDLRVHAQNMYRCSICEQRFTRQSVLYDHRCTG